MTPQDSHETSPLERWLKKVGFSRGNPFGLNEADREPFVPECFVDPGVYDAVKNDPNTALVFAARGSGKTALRVMLSSDCRPLQPLNANPRSSVLAVTYSDFSPALEACGHDLKQITAGHHVTRILSDACAALLDALWQDPELATKLPSPERSRFASYCRQYNPALLDAWEAHRRLRTIFLETRIKAKLEAKRKEQAQTGAKAKLDPEAEASAKAETETEFEAEVSWPQLRQAVQERCLEGYLRELALPPSSGLMLYAELVDDTPAPAPDQDSPKTLLSGFVELVTSTGLQGVFFLVDRLDEHLQTFDAPEKLATLIAPLVTDLPLMEVSFKLFLPHETYAAVMNFVRSDRIRVLEVTWDDEHLRRLLQLRLQVYSNDRIQSLSKVCEKALAASIEDEMVEMADGSPRRLVQLGAALFKTHAVHAPGKYAITEPEWAQAHAEVIGKRYIKPLRVDRRKAQVYLGATLVPLSPTLYRFVACLYDTDGFCTNPEILQTVWGKWHSDDNVRQTASRVRKALEEIGADPDLYIDNEPGRGYKLLNKA